MFHLQMHMLLKNKYISLLQQTTFSAVSCLSSALPNLANGTEVDSSPNLVEKGTTRQFRCFTGYEVSDGVDTANTTCEVNPSGGITGIWNPASFSPCNSKSVDVNNTMKGYINPRTPRLFPSQWTPDEGWESKGPLTASFYLSQVDRFGMCVALLILSLYIILTITCD